MGLPDISGVSEQIIIDPLMLMLGNFRLDSDEDQWVLTDGADFFRCTVVFLENFGS